MILGDTEILRLFRHNHIYSPDNVCLVNPASVNIRLGETFLIPKRKWLKGVRLGGEVQYKSYRVDSKKSDAAFRLMPGQFALATTMEGFIIPPNLAAYVQGQSSIGRAGLTVQNAGFIDPGFHGHITLELKNETCNPIDLRPGYPVAQVIFEQTTPVEKPYAGKYNGQIEATGSRMFLDRVMTQRGR